MPDRGGMVRRRHRLADERVDDVHADHIVVP